MGRGRQRRLEPFRDPFGERRECPEFGDPFRNPHKGDGAYGDAAYYAWCDQQRRIPTEPLGRISDRAQPPPELMEAYAARTLILLEADKAGAIPAMDEIAAACERLMGVVISLLGPLAQVCNAHAADAGRTVTSWIPEISVALDSLARVAFRLRARSPAAPRPLAEETARVAMDAQMASLEVVAAPLGWRMPATIVEADRNTAAQTRIVARKRFAEEVANEIDRRSEWPEDEKRSEVRVIAIDDGNHRPRVALCEDRDGHLRFIRWTTVQAPDAADFTIPVVRVRGVPRQEMQWGGRR